MDLWFPVQFQKGNYIFWAYISSTCIPPRKYIHTLRLRQCPHHLNDNVKMSTALLDELPALCPLVHIVDEY